MSTYQNTDILVLGATGFVGSLVVKFLNDHRERSKFTFTISGRSKGKLQALAVELNLNAQIPLLELDIEDIPSLERAIKRARVVINTVGPFWLTGTPVVRICAQNGVHYTDITGEPVWARKMIDEYDFLAYKTGAIILPFCGYDSIPSDLSVYVSSQRLKDQLPGVLIGKSVTAHEHKGGISFGTFSTIYTHFNDVPASDRAAAISPDYLSPMSQVSWVRPRLVYSLPFQNRTIYGGIHLMGVVNQPNVYRTRGLFEISRQMEAVRYGPSFTYEEFYETPGRLRAFLISSFLAFMAVFLNKSGFVLALFKRFIVDRARNPSIEEMENGYLTLYNVTETADTKPTMKATSTIKIKGDPGYLCTAVMVVECAIALLDPSKLTSLARGGGLLTPVSALGDELVKRLQDTGRFTFETGEVVQVPGS